MGNLALNNLSDILKTKLGVNDLQIGHVSNLVLIDSDTSDLLALAEVDGKMFLNTRLRVAKYLVGGIETLLSLIQQLFDLSSNISIAIDSRKNSNLVAIDYWSRSD